MRSIARQVNLSINNLHIRYEDDYFSGGQPYTMGCVIESVQLTQSKTGQELWNFADFLEPIFNRVSARRASPGNTAEEVKDDQVVFKDLAVTGCKFYVNTRSQVFIPTSLWELKQNLPNTIFDDLPPDLLMALMKETSTLNFIMDPVDIYANIGDINSQQFFFSLVAGKVNMTLTPGTVSNLNKLIEY